MQLYVKGCLVRTTHLIQRETRVLTPVQIQCHVQSVASSDFLFVIYVSN